MSNPRYLRATAALLAALFTLTFAAPSFAEDEAELIGILQSDAPKAEKALTCKKLAIWGSAKAVPSLAALLPDPELTSWARIALEAIPNPAVDQAFREALASLEGRPLVGVINSIGVRRDAKAVAGLVERINDDDAAVASAAAVALGHIGNQPATTALQAALSRYGASSAIAEGCILCAEKLLAKGNPKEAAKLYDEVRGACCS